MTIKDQAIEMLHRLPDDCTMEDIQYHLYVLEKIRKGREDAANGRTIPHEEVKRRIARWREQLG